MRRSAEAELGESETWRVRREGNGYFADTPFTMYYMLRNMLCVLHC
jgi:hypothetical protein